MDPHALSPGAGGPAWLTALTRLSARGEAAVLVTVSAARGHTPREAGARMVVSLGGTWGSVGGGNLEATATERARALLAAGESPRDERIPAPEHAAWTQVASLVLNLSETVMRN